MDLIYFFGLLNIKDPVVDIDNPKVERMFSSPFIGKSLVEHQQHRVKLLKYIAETDEELLARLSSNKRLFAVSPTISISCTRDGTRIPLPRDQDLIFDLGMRNVSKASIVFRNHDDDIAETIIVPFTAKATKNGDIYVLENAWIPICLMRFTVINIEYIPAGQKLPMLQYRGIMFGEQVEHKKPTFTGEYNSIDLFHSMEPGKLEKISESKHIRFFFGRNEIEVYSGRIKAV